MALSSCGSANKLARSPKHVLTLALAHPTIAVDDCDIVSERGRGSERGREGEATAATDVGLTGRVTKFFFLDRNFVNKPFGDCSIGT